MRRKIIINAEIHKKIRCFIAAKWKDHKFNYAHKKMGKGKWATSYLKNIVEQICSQRMFATQELSFF